MFDALIAACGRAADTMGPAPTIQSVCEGAQIISPHVMAVGVTGGDLPWGRYLIHHDPDDRFNIQLDVFSPGYTGGVHAHETWGAFWLLQGKLRVWDYQATDDGPQLARYGLAGPGGFSCFCPPISDWHRVGTLSDGPQTVSIHIYGSGFDLNTGIALNDQGKVHSYRRGAWGDLDRVRHALTVGDV